MKKRRAVLLRTIRGWEDRRTDSQRPRLSLWCDAGSALRWSTVVGVLGAAVCGLLLAAALTAETTLRLTFSALMTAIAVKDWRHRVIPDSLVVSGALVGSVMTVYAGQFAAHAGDAAACGGFMMLLRACGTRILRRESLGLGDVKLSALIGFVGGVERFFLIAWLASVSCLVFAVARRKGDGSGRRPIPPADRTGGLPMTADLLPYGAFLAVVAVVVLWLWADARSPVEALFGADGALATEAGWSSLPLKPE